MELKSSCYPSTLVIRGPTMNTYKRIGIVIGVVVVCALVKLEALALSDDTKRLRGLNGVGVVVEKIAPQVEREGLSQTQLRTDMEVKLRLAGIRVLSEQETSRMPSQPLLYLNVSIVKTQAGYVFAIRVALEEKVRTLRHFNMPVPAKTWEGTGALGINSSLSHIRNTAKVLLDEFIKAYLAVNPK